MTWNEMPVKVERMCGRSFVMVCDLDLVDCAKLENKRILTGSVYRRVLEVVRRWRESRVEGRDFLVPRRSRRSGQARVMPFSSGPKSAAKYNLCDNG